MLIMSTKNKAVTEVTEYVSFWWKMKSNSFMVMDSVLRESMSLALMTNHLFNPHVI